MLSIALSGLDCAIIEFRIDETRVIEKNSLISINNNNNCYFNEIKEESYDKYEIFYRDENNILHSDKKLYKSKVIPK